MSLQRVLETARKAGLPVIVTDIAGREPMVVLPLEQFEAMVGEGEQPEPAPRRTASVPFEPVADPVERAFAEMAAERLKNKVEEVAIQLENLAEQTDQNGEISLEERFYLEPVDEKDGG